jgi:hypothetical protein
MSGNARLVFEKFIHSNFKEALNISPDDSLTPFQVGNIFNGEEEFLFVAKCTPFIYKSLKGRRLEQETRIQMSMYNEDKKLIIRFELLDITLETEIREEQIKGFLSVLYNQEKITLAVVDASTYKLIWVTNTIPFKAIRTQYQEVFDKYGVSQ